MKAEILCVGTELLLGNTVNTNATFLSRELAALGIDLYYHIVVGDNPQRLRDTLDLCFSRSDIVIMTGGLGPTYDDLTKETVAAYFGLEMELNEPALESIAAFFRKLNREMTENNRKQAMIPKGAAIFPNEHGTAPGIGVTKNGKTAILLPGPPKEMGPMFEKSAAPYLHALAGNKVFVSQKINLFGIGESSAEAQLADLMKDAVNPTIAPYVSTGELYIRVTASAAGEEEARSLIAPVRDEIVSRMGDYAYAIDAGSLQAQLVAELTAKGRRIAVAESLTGGLVAKRITDVAGSSAVFDAGLCAYSNDMKERLLGVSHDTLVKYGAVSAQTAEEMAVGALRVAGADIGISTTGIAGPGGGTDKKPVGLVYIAAATKDGVKSLRLDLQARARGREEVRSVTAANVLHLALMTLRGMDG